MYRRAHGLGREYLRIVFFTEDQIALALKMVDDRNKTTHTYYQEIASEKGGQIENIEK